MGRMATEPYPTVSPQILLSDSAPQQGQGTSVRVGSDCIVLAPSRFYQPVIYSHERIEKRYIKNLIRFHKWAALRAKRDFFAGLYPTLCPLRQGTRKEIRR